MFDDLLPTPPMLTVGNSGTISLASLVGERGMGGGGQSSPFRRPNYRQVSQSGCLHIELLGEDRDSCKVLCQSPPCFRVGDSTKSLRSVNAWDL